MIIAPTQDAELIKSVLFHPEIWPHISEDGVQQPEQIRPALYLAGHANGDLVGIFTCRPVKRYLFDVHVQVLPEHRQAHGLTFGLGVIDWVWNNTQCEKMTAQIPLCCENVKRFAVKCGFVVEGINRKSWRKDGRFWDSYYLGIVRGE